MSLVYFFALPSRFQLPEQSPFFFLRHVIRFVSLAKISYLLRRALREAIYIKYFEATFSSVLIHQIA